MHLVKKCLEESCFDFRVIIELLNNESHKVSIHQEPGLLHCFKDIILHLSEAKLSIGAKILICCSHASHSSHATHSSHHCGHIKSSSRKPKSLSLLAIRYHGDIIDQVKGIWTTETRDKVPSRDTLHLYDNIRRLLSLCHNVRINSFICVEKVSELILGFLFSKTSTQDDVEVVYAEMLSVLAEFVEEGFYGTAGFGARRLVGDLVCV